ncbi:hypothetical protein, partial [Pelagicoccus sp. SDUM812002]|uniref:hypothetical protein n=1 Tax=Pelagicoccus sp. SDUM812002 TaxID=3041266 RepID=UPI00280E73EE
MIEFARAGNPLRFDGEALEKAEFDNKAGAPALTVSYRRNAIMVGVEDGFEYSEDLRDWTEL